MKKVVSSEMVAHLWANQSQSEARNSNKHLFFEAETIYSYGKHFPIASHHQTKDGQHIILFTTQSYSKTTAKHIRITKRAIASDANVIACHNVLPRYEAEHLRNLKDMVDELLELTNKAAMARTCFDFYYAKIEKTVSRHAAYRKAFGLEQVSDILSLPDDWKEQAKRRLAAQREQMKENQARQMAKEALRKQHAIENMLAWVEGAEMPHDDVRSFDFPEIRLRLKNEQTVETSRGAEIPVSHARTIWTLVHLIYIGDKPEYEHTDHSLHAGSFVVQSIKSDGSLRAGCHLLKYDAMQDFASKMHWPMPVAGQTALEF